MAGHYFLVGLPGSGKTTLAKRVAARRGFPWLDLDDAIVNATSQRIAQLFEASGEAGFRERERQALNHVLATQQGPTVIATGGGAPCHADNLSRMKAAGTVIWLDPPLAVIAKRLGEARTERPMFQGLDAPAIEQKLTSLYAARRIFYAQADHRIDAAHLPAAEAALLALLAV